jgi:uracil-DNA glycosylase
MITNAVRCAPPGNKPTSEEESACRPHLIARIDALPRLRVVVTLGDVARRNLLRALGAKAGAIGGGHATEFEVGDIRVINSYHCSRLNTNTGRLTPPMFKAVFERARALLS